MDEPTVLAQHAYMLFYTKCAKPDAPPPTLLHTQSADVDPLQKCPAGAAVAPPKPAAAGAAETARLGINCGSGGYYDILADQTAPLCTALR